MLRRANDHHRNIRARLYAPASANAADLDRHLMIAAAFSSFPHPAEIRGWHLAHQPPHMAREPGFAMFRALGPIHMRRKSTPRICLVDDTAADPGRGSFQAANFPTAAMTKSP
jgi:hypothetical protein